MNLLTEQTLGSYGFPESVRTVSIILNVLSLPMFALAIMHARDNVDRLYLIGGAVIVAGIAGGTVVRFHSSFNPFIILNIAGVIVWALALRMSRRRRRNRLGDRARIRALEAEVERLTVRLGAEEAGEGE